MPVLIHHALSRIDTLTMPYIDSGRHARLGKALRTRLPTRVLAQRLPISNAPSTKEE